MHLNEMRASRRRAPLPARPPPRKQATGSGRRPREGPRPLCRALPRRASALAARGAAAREGEEPELREVGVAVGSRAEGGERAAARAQGRGRRGAGAGARAPERPGPGVVRCRPSVHRCMRLAGWLVGRGSARRCAARRCAARRAQQRAPLSAFPLLRTQAAGSWRHSCWSSSMRCEACGGSQTCGASIHAGPAPAPMICASRGAFGSCDASGASGASGCAACTAGRASYTSAAP